METSKPDQQELPATSTEAAAEHKEKFFRRMGIENQPQEIGPANVPEHNVSDQEKIDSLHSEIEKTSQSTAAMEIDKHNTFVRSAPIASTEDFKNWWTEAEKDMYPFEANKNAMAYAETCDFLVAGSNPKFELESYLYEKIKKVKKTDANREASRSALDYVGREIIDTFQKARSEMAEAIKITEGIDPSDLTNILRIFNQDLTTLAEKTGVGKSISFKNPVAREESFNRAKEQYFKQKADEEKKKNSVWGRVKSWLGR